MCDLMYKNLQNALLKDLVDYKRPMVRAKNGEQVENVTVYNASISSGGDVKVAGYSINDGPVKPLGYKPTAKVCDCSTVTLMRSGCICGGV